MQTPLLNSSPDLKIAAAYIRVSTEDQVEYSPDAQIVEIRKYATTHGYILPDEYMFIDEGISGKNTIKRNNFNNMIGVAKTTPKPFDAILLWKFSRFARNREDSVVYKSMLRKQLGIDVISISEPVGDDKMSVIIEAMIEAMDEYYSINLAEEVKRGMSEKARRGELQSSPSFGYRAENNTLVPIPEEVELVKALFRRFQNGEGFFPLSKWMNSIGATTHRGNQFENRTIEYILRNPVYIGKLRWNPSGRSRRDFTNENIILADAVHEPLIDMDTWDQVQTIIAEQKALRKYHARPTTEKKDWLSGIIRCGACDGTLIFSKPHYFKCNNYVRGSCKHSQHTKVDLLHDAIIAQLQADSTSLASPAFNVLHRTDTSADELSTLERSLTQIKRKKERLREAFLNGADTVEEYGQMKQHLAQEENAINVRLVQLRSADTSVDTATIMRNKILDCLETLIAPDSTLEQKYVAANMVIERCTYHKLTNSLAVTYRLVF